MKNDEKINGKMQEKVQKLRKQGIDIYSYSKLSTFHQCKYEYYKTYILRQRGKQNVYAHMGSCIHDAIEAFYIENKDRDYIIQKYHEGLAETELFGMEFPNEKIGNSWKADFEHFLYNFERMDRDMVTEKLIVFEPVEGVWMQGYIDVIMPKGEDKIDILDWKTSSKFSGKKIHDAGKQLVLYKIGMEQIEGKPVDEVMWFMFKYVDVCWRLKNGKIKRKMCSRRKWVQECENPIRKDLDALGIDEFEIDMLMGNAIKNNNIDSLPQEIQDKYILEDSIVKYDVTDEVVDRVKNYVKDTVDEIRDMDHADESVWTPVKIDMGTSFYCANLCGHSHNCKHYKKFVADNKFRFKQK